MILALVFVVLALASFRLTWLVTRDEFPPIFAVRTWIQNMRPGVTRMQGPDQVWRYWWLGELVSCPWCASAYVSAGVVFVAWLLIASMPLPVFWWLAVWGATAYIAHQADE